MESNVTEKELAAAAVAPRVTLADLESEIAYVGYFTALEGVNAGGALTMTKHASDALRLLTFAVVVLRNGFTVTGQSACASPENFNEAIGRRLALQDVHRQLWPLLGFRLRDKLAAVPAPVVARERVSLPWVSGDAGGLTARYLLARDGVVFYRVYNSDPAGMFVASAGHVLIGTYLSRASAIEACELHAAGVSA